MSSYEKKLLILNLLAVQFLPLQYPNNDSTKRKQYEKHEIQST